MALEQEMPDQIRGGFEFVRVYISESGLPDGFADVLLAPAVSAPDETAIDVPDVLAALDSVVKVEGNANDCNTRLTGSGFVVGPDLIITNAHVVAGVTSPTVRVKGKGKAFEGTIVYFDPNKDVALIRVDDFPSVQLDISEPLEREASAVAAGFPGGGPLELIPARIRGISLSTGTNIYGEGEVTREIYAIAADIKQGDSGAPLFALDGSVAGLVFASSATDSQTGYALTAKEFMVGVEAAKSATKAVDTGDCSSV
jgi:S1-C subfamily serine protease